MAEVEWFGGKVREAGLRCHKHVQRRDSGNTGQRVLNIELRSWRKRKRFMNAVKEDAQRVGKTEEDAKDIVSWKKMLFRLFLK